MNQLLLTLVGKERANEVLEFTEYSDQQIR